MKRNRNLIVGVALAVLVLASSVPFAEAATKSTADTFDFNLIEQGGKSKLVRNSSGITFNFKTVGTGVYPGFAYTVWFVVFNDPDSCKTCDEDGVVSGDGDCGADDIFWCPLAGSEVDVLYGGGNVAGKGGRIHIAGHRAEGDSSGSVYQDIFGFPESPGLSNPLGAEVHLVLRSHGPKVPAQMPAQIDSFDGGCTNEIEPPGLAMNEGDCADTQFSIHVD